MNRRKLLPLSFLMLGAASFTVKAQTPFTTVDSLNINRINASALVHGDMWWDPAALQSHCSYPNGSGINIAIAGGMWVSGYDAGNNLHITAQTYRQRGNDFWPGPLDASDTLTYATSQNWAKIWKLNRTDIQIFQALSATGSATTSNTAAAIWSWPAKGNTNAKGRNDVPLTVTDDMAPFVDVNANGIYEPQLGDYPDVKGDQVLWWVFSDNGPAHSETHGKPLGIEVHAMAYAYNRGNSIDNVIYYNYSIKNKSSNNYHDLRIGQLADMDLGMYNDDYVGFDSNRAMGICYNKSRNDGLYDTVMPMAGLIIRSAAGAGSFMYYSNAVSPTGYPVTDVEHNNYLRSTFRDGTHAINDFTVFGVNTSGYGTGTPTKYLFPGDPGNHTEWSECSSSNNAGDRNFVIASGDMTLNAGATTTINMILVASPLGQNNACEDTGVSFTGIQHVADTAIAILDGGGLPPIPLAVPNVTSVDGIKLYPNPAHEQLYIETSAKSAVDATIVVYNAMGQAINIPVEKTGEKYVLDIAQLPPGLYNVLYRSGPTQTTSKFIKK